MQKPRKAENYLLTLGKCPLVVSQPAPAILWPGPKGMGSEIAPLPQPPQWSPLQVRSTCSAQMIISMRTGKMSHSPTHPHLAWCRDSARRQTLGNCLSNKGLTELFSAVSLQFLHPEALLISIKEISQPHPCQEQHADCYNRIPFLPPLHPPIF